MWLHCTGTSCSTELNFHISLAEKLSYLVLPWGPGQQAVGKVAAAVSVVISKSVTHDWLILALEVSLVDTVTVKNQ